MVAGIPRLQRRGAVYWFRAKVPSELVSILKRREYRGSLKTRDLAEARRLVSLRSVQVDAEIAAAREKLQSSPVRVNSESEAQYAALRWFHGREVEIREERTALDEHSREELRQSLLPVWRDLQNPDHPNTEQAVQGEVTTFLSIPHSRVKWNDPAIRHFCELVRRGMVESLARQLKALGTGRGPEGDPLFSQIGPTSGPCVLQRPILLGELITRYEAQRAAARSPKTRIKRRAQMRLIKEVLGEHTPISEIRRAQIVQFRTLLSELPANATKFYPGLSSQASAARAKRDDRDPMTATTANSYLRALYTLLAFAVNEELISRNPAEGVRLPDDKSSRRPPAPFSTEELRAIFNGRYYQEPFPGTASSESPGKFWVPLIALFTGMRLNEICQLDAADIDCRDNVHVIRIQAGNGKRLKTAAAERTIPVHPELQRLGLLKYSANVCKEGKLFPELKVGSTGYASDPFGKWFARYLRAVGAKNGWSASHRFRHTFRDALREADLSAEQVRALGGWSSGRTEDNYGAGLGTKRMAAAIERVGYPELDLSHLYPKPAVLQARNG